jgi:protein-tyrosine phosphatase
MRPRWEYALAFTLIGCSVAMLAATAGSPGWLLAWPAASSLIVAAAYASLGPAVFGKRPDGTLAPWSLALNLPFLLFAWGVWHVQRRLTREPCRHEISPGLWLGRRPFPHELPTGVTRVIDLTAEFIESRRVRTGRIYECLPTLDGSTPPAAALCDLAVRLAAEPGVTYIHCAQGHGRFALVVAAVRIARGLAADPEQAVAMIRAARPGVRIGKDQRALLTCIPRPAALAAVG